MFTGIYEVAGTHFEKGVFEIYLEKKAPVPLSWFLKIGPISGRLVGLALLAFSFLFSTSRAPMTLIMEQGIAMNPEEALKLQQTIGYGFFFIAVLFYMTVFLFRQEKMALLFNKSSQLFSVIREPMFRFTSSQRGHVPFKDLHKPECIKETPSAPHGKVILKSDKMPKGLQEIEFAVLTAEQFEYFL
ncbi:MAG: hypothetical protein R3A80_05530 [Bdellovibrionota bacterium]